MIQASVRSPFTYIISTISNYTWTFFVVIIMCIIYDYPENGFQNVTGAYKQVRVLSC